MWFEGGEPQSGAAEEAATTQRPIRIESGPWRLQAANDAMKKIFYKHLSAEDAIDGSFDLCRLFQDGFGILGSHH